MFVVLILVHSAMHAGMFPPSIVLSMPIFTSILVICPRNKALKENYPECQVAG